MLTHWFNRLTDQFFFMRLRTRVILYMMLFLILGSSVFVLYKDYESNLAVQQQQHMLSISKSISRSIELFISESVDSMKILTLDSAFVADISQTPTALEKHRYTEKLKSYSIAEGSPLFGAYLFDTKGNMLSYYSQGNVVSSVLKQEVKTATIRKLPYTGIAYLDPNRRTFILNIYEPIFKDKNFIGTFCVSIDLNVIYDKLIDPVQIGKKGYALVKDQKGTIIMHKLKDQVGINVIETRKAMYPNLDFKELEALINVQLKGIEGTSIYHSYWWADQKLEKAKKLSAFSPVDLGDHFWVVALTMSYDEIQVPMNQFLFGIFFIALFVAVVFHFFIQALTKARKSKEELEQETQYLKMLNESSEQLRLQEAELYHSQKLKMIGTLAGGISHDINNLLTPIYGYSELLLGQMTPEHVFFEEIYEIYAASKKGKDLIEQLLLFSRKDNGMTSVSLVDMNQVTSETVRLLKTILPKNINIITNLEPNCGLVKANFTQLHQVIFNLCTNAYQAIKEEDCPEKEETIEVTLKKIPVSLINDLSPKEEESYNFVELTITDTGCGMDSGTKERIFEPFFTTKDIGDGTGLGLFVVKSIIDKYGGQIHVETKPGQGSTFKVYFQIASNSDTVDQKDAPSSPHSAPLHNLKPLKLLIVDDNETVIRLLRKGLEFYGYEVETEISSVKALKRIRSTPEAFDILITDYMMPDQNGIELAKKAKRIKKNLGIVLMTGFMDEDQVESAAHSAIDTFILKPIEIAGLSEALQNVYIQYFPANL